MAVIAQTFNVTPDALQASAQKRGDTAFVTAAQLPATPKLSEAQSGLIPGMDVQLDGDGQVRRARGEYRTGARTAEAAAQGFLKANAGALNLSSNLGELQPFLVQESLTGHHIRFKQVYQGQPVFGGWLSVHTDKSFTVRLLNHDMIPMPGAGKRALAKGDTARAIETAVSAVPSTEGPSTTPMAESGVVIKNGSPVSAVRVTFDTRVPAAAWEVMIDSETYRSLSVKNIAHYVDGTGKVFNINPIVSSGNLHLADNNDADSAELTAELVDRVLKDLVGDGTLKGPFVSTEPTTNQTRANESTHVFNYKRNDDRFEEVMCYYWLDTSQRYIQSLGFNNINNRVQGVNVNGIPDDNSFYSGATKDLTLGTGGVDDAEDADVIMHEYGHSIQDNQVPGWGQTNEGGAMGEGFGDYWAGSTSANVGPKGAAWNPFIAEWDATSYNPGNPAFLRRLDSTKKYPTDIVGQVHADGEIWSACLWQIWNLIGKTRADKIILEAHFQVSPTGGFVDAANAILAANQSLFQGQDQAEIRQIFVDRGILQAILTAPTNLRVSMPDFTTALLEWNDNSNNEQGFKIERKIGSGAFAQIGTVPANTTRFTHGNLSPNTTYTYRVRAFGALGDSGATNEVTITTPDPTFSISGTVRNGNAAFEGVTVTASATVYLRHTQGVSPNLNIPDNDPVGIEAPMVVDQIGSITEISVTVDITHPRVQDLQVSLVHPNGGVVVLHNQTTGSANLQTSYPDPTAPAQSLNGFLNRPLNGTWKLRVKDLAGNNTGRINSYSIRAQYSGAFTRSVQTGPNGTYTLTGLPTGTYTVTARRTNNTFSPSYRTVAVGPSRTGIDFAAGQGTLQSISVSPNSVPGGTSATGTVTLAQPAPTGGSTVILYTQSNVLQVPSEIVIPAGQTTGSFTINTLPVGADYTRYVYASLGSITRTAAVNLKATPQLTSFTVNPSTVKSGSSTTGSVRLNIPAPAGGLTVQIIEDSSALNAPTSVVIPAGQTSVSFTIQTSRITFTANRLVTARLFDRQMGQWITLTP